MQKQTKIPKSCEGMLLYDNGATCHNPFTGRKVELNNVELSLYELIRGAEALGQWKLVEDIRDWFIKNNIKAYGILID